MSKGEQLMQQAEKRLKKWSIFGGGGKARGRRIRGGKAEASELFEKAANQFKIAKEFKPAGKVKCDDAGKFSHAAKLLKELGEYHKDCDNYAHARGRGSHRERMPLSNGAH
eukprot:gene42407-36274_t